jgi:DNA uptake protein ComE-like DNA-binding protein
MDVVEQTKGNPITVPIEIHASQKSLNEEVHSATVRSDSKSPAAATSGLKPATKYIDLNSADKKALMSLPGITEADAEQIIAGRPYRSTLQFKIRNIIAPEKYLKIASQIVAKQMRSTANNSIP